MLPPALDGYTQREATATLAPMRFLTGTAPKGPLDSLRFAAPFNVDHSAH